MVIPACPVKPIQGRTSVEGLVDMGGYPELYCDGIAQVEQLRGQNVRLLLFTWRKFDGIYRRTACGAIVCPADSWLGISAQQMQDWAIPPNPPLCLGAH